MTERKPDEGTPDRPTEKIPATPPTQVVPASGPTPAAEPADPPTVVLSDTADEPEDTQDPGDTGAVDTPSADGAGDRPTVQAEPAAEPVPGPSSTGPSSAGPAAPPRPAPAASTPAPMPAPVPVPASRGPRAGTVVWGLIVAVIGLGALAATAGYRIDSQLAFIVLLAVGGVSLLIGSLVSAARRRKTEEAAPR